MGGHINYNFPSIANASSGMGTTAGAISGKLSELQSSVSQLLANWESESASVSFNEVQNTFQTTSADLNQMLQQLGSATGTAGDNMQAVERQNASRF